MEYIAQLKPTLTMTATPTGTLSVNPPGGTHHHHGPSHTDHLPLPTIVRPTHVVEHIRATQTGNTALWIIFALFTAGLFGVMLLALRVEKRSRIFHWLSALVLTFAMTSYLAMASGLGIDFVPTKSYRSDVTFLREVYYARYVDWLFTTPLLLLSLGLLAGLSPADTTLVIFFDIFMVVTGLFAGETPAGYARGERSRWILYAVSCVGFLGIWYILLTGGLSAARLRPKKTRGLFTLLGGMTLLLWTGYPIVFGLTEGANKISVDAEIISYGILDVAAKLGFTFLLLLIHTHGEDDTWILPDWFVSHRSSLGQDGRGPYGAVADRDD